MLTQAPDKSLREIVEEAATHLDGFDREFFGRCWKTELEIYRNRLRAIGFSGAERVLDAGSGNGQWTLCLTEMNGFVSAIDVSTPRLKATQHILDSLGVTNCDLDEQSVSETRFADETFDRVFCYGVMCFCDHRRTLAEFYRVLKPGGRLYVCSNGLGWYLYNVLTPHNPSASFDVREMAFTAIENTVSYFACGRVPDGTQLAVPGEVMERDALAAGFRSVLRGAEGTLAPVPGYPVQSFFRAEYHGREGIYELICDK